MSELLVKIPARVSDNFGEPIDVLISYVAAINLSKDDTIHFDFSECKFTNPFIIGGVVCLAKDQEKKGKKIRYSYNESNENLIAYFKTICFPSGFEHEKYSKEELIKALEPYHTKNYIPLVCFPGLEHGDSTIRERILEAVDGILKNQLNLSGSLLSAVYFLTQELTQNIADHSGSEKGIMFAQFYPSKNYLDLCIADFGKGLYQSYIDTGKHAPASNKEAFDLVLKGESTKDRAESRGFGISTSRSMLVDGLKGKFLIYSGDAFYVQTVERAELITLSSECYYQGCLVALRIPILENKGFNLHKYTEK